MKLYFSKGACSLGVRITLHEIGIACEYIPVDLKAKKLANGDDFLKINPKGSVPVLVTDDNEVLTENAAIQIYLAEYKKAENMLPKVGDFKRYRVLEWLSYVSSDVHKAFGPLFNPAFPQDVKEKLAIPNLKSKLSFLDKNLAQKMYLVGDDFTLPDSYLFVVLSWLPKVKIDMSEWPNVAGYFDNLKKRKSIEEALAEEF
jgi:glutathione S-transferase